VSEWFAVQCVFLIEAGSVLAERGQVYEERITLWHATSHEEAIARAEVEAERYARDSGFSRVEYVTTYELFDSPGDAAEVWSVMRDSWLPPTEYISQFVERGYADPSGRAELDES
jgi:hypothetical protein